MTATSMIEAIQNEMHFAKYEVCGPRLNSCRRPKAGIHFSNPWFQIQNKYGLYRVRLAWVAVFVLSVPDQTMADTALMNKPSRTVVRTQ